MKTIKKAIVLAGGVGNRFSGHYIPKQFVEINGKPILAFTLENIQAVEEIDQTILVINDSYKQLYIDILKSYKIDRIKCVSGGETRQESIGRGLAAAENADFVLIQNGVCPMTPASLMSTVLEKSVSTGEAASAYIEVVDTIVRNDNGHINEYFERSSLVRLQAPQTFPYELLKECHDRAICDGFNDVTNDADLIQKYGHNMHLVRGRFDNIKVTTTEDWLLARLILGGFSLGSI